MTTETERIEGIMKHVAKSKDAFVEAMKDPEFKKAADDMHEAYVEMLRGDTPKDWHYRCDWASTVAFNQMMDILGDEMRVAVLSLTPNNMAHFTVFISPKGMDMLKDYKAKQNDIQ